LSQQSPFFPGASAAHAQFGSGVVYDPTQSAHAIERIEQGQNIFTNSVKLAGHAIATYNLIHQLSLAPQSLYQPYLSPSTSWTALIRPPTPMATRSSG
jgi:hypothetical protein